MPGIRKNEKLGSLSQTAVLEDKHNQSGFFQMVPDERSEVNEAAEIMALRQY